MSATSPAGTDKAPKHEIGLVACLAFSVGTMIGGGVFALSGIVVDKTGPGSILAYILAGIVMLFSALCFAAVASRSKAGDSGYGPIGETLGPLWRFVTMWAFYVSGITLMAFVLLSFGAYLRDYFVSGTTAVVAALVAAAALFLLNLGPADLVGRAETVMVALKISILLLLVGFGLAAFAPDRLTPFIPDGTGSVVTATALLFTAYTGFNVVTNMAGAVRKPERTVPLSILLSIGIVAVIYVGVAIALLMSGEKDFGNAGLAKAAEALMGHWGMLLVAFAACVSTLSGANANLLGASELMIRMSAQRDVPSVLARSTKRGHPLLSVGLASILAGLLVLTNNSTMVVSFSNVSAIIAMLVVDAAAFRMGWQRWAGPGMKLPGRVLIPVLAFAAAASQLPSLGWSNVAIGTAMVAVGLLFYAQRHLGPAHLVDEAQQRIRELETPLMRALRRPRRDLVEAPPKGAA